MNYRLAQLLAQKSWAADHTETIDIDVVDPISQLIIELCVTGGGTQQPTAHAIACLPKIELVDGSDVLYSLSGYQAEAVDWYHNLKMRSNWNIYLGTSDVQRFIGINFGRKLWDPLLAFDPKRFRNPQLKLSLDIDAGGMAPSANKLRVWAALFDQKTISPAGFLMHKELKNYTMGSASHEYTDLPRDYPYRKFFIRAQSGGTEPEALVDKIKFYEDEGKRVIVPDELWSTVLRTIAVSPMMVEHIYHFADQTLRNLYCTPASRVACTANTWDTTTGAGEIAVYDGDGGKLRKISASGSKNAQFIVCGWNPHATIEIPFGDQDDPADWYDVAKVGSLKSDILSLAAGNGISCQQFVQQYRKY